MKKSIRYYRLPDKTATTSLKRFTREWNRIIKPMEKLTKMKVTGFDPGLQLSDVNEKSWPTVSLPLWFCERILKNK